MSWGGAFIGGIVYGEYRSEGAEAQATPRVAGGGQFTQAARSGDGADSAARGGTPSRQGGFGGGQAQRGGPSNGVFTRQEGRTGVPGGQATPGESGGPAEDRSADAQSSGNEAGEPPVLPGMGRGGFLAGTIEAVEERNVTIDTEGGTVSAAVSEETVFLTVREAGIEDLSEGVEVVAVGRRGEEGLTARALLLNPDGVDVRFLDGRPPGAGQDKGVRRP